MESWKTTRFPLISNFPLLVMVFLLSLELEMSSDLWLGINLWQMEWNCLTGTRMELDAFLQPATPLVSENENPFRTSLWMIFGHATSCFPCIWWIFTSVDQDLWQAKNGKNSLERGWCSTECDWNYGVSELFPGKTSTESNFPLYLVPMNSVYTVKYT